MMKRVVVHKAASITSRSPEVEGCIIEISEDLPEFSNETTWKGIESYYASEARMIADALFDHLPQGIFEPLLIELMQRRISIYRGVSNS